VHEGPVVMGWARWRETEEHFSFGIIRASVAALVESGEIEEVPVEVMARLLYGALSAGASMIAGAADPRKAGEEVAWSITRVVSGLRRPAAAGADAPPEPADPPGRRRRR
jgi:hypothetical protein